METISEFLLHHIFGTMHWIYRVHLWGSTNQLSWSSYVMNWFYFASNEVLCYHRKDFLCLWVQFQSVNLIFRTLCIYFQEAWQPIGVKVESNNCWLQNKRLNTLSMLPKVVIFLFFIWIYAQLDFIYISFHRNIFMDMCLFVYRLYLHNLDKLSNS